MTGSPSISDNGIHTRVESDDWYAGLDPGIRFAVRVLHAAGIETCQSCQGGDGHSYEWPTVDLPDGPRDAAGFAALHHLEQYGLEVFAVSRVWNVEKGLPHESLWRIELRRSAEDRADDKPIFEWGYRGAVANKDAASVGPTSLSSEAAGAGNEPGAGAA